MRTAILISGVLIAKSLKPIDETTANFVAWVITICIAIDLAEFINKLFKK